MLRTVAKYRRKHLVALAVLVPGVVVANLWWLYSYRRGLPYNIDESGYLQRGVLYQQELARHGLLGLSAAWSRPDIVAPLLPLVAALLRAVAGLSPFGMLGTVELFYGLIVIGAYLLARQLTSDGWALVSAIVVACLPGTIDGGRVFLLAEPCAAMYVLLIAAQIWADRFQSLRRSLLWGATLGVTSLTRTMVLALLAAPLLVAAARLLLLKPSIASIRNATLGFALAVLIGGSWYRGSWDAVRSYLTTYGYGSQAGAYGHHHSIATWGWWTGRFVNIVDQDVYLPLLIALSAAMIATLWRLAASRTRSRYADSSASATPRGALSEVRRLIENDAVCIALILAGSYVVLSTSQNSGSYFELPLVAPLVCVLVSRLRRSGAAARVAVAASLLIAGALTMVDQLNLLPLASRYSSVQLSGLSATAFNANEVDFSGPKLHGSHLGGIYWTDCGGATITCFYGRSRNIDLPYVSSWGRLSPELVDFIYSFAAAHHRSPVVFFAYQGPLLNTNSVSLVAQLEGRNLPIGALMDPALRHGATLSVQIEAPNYGQPNFVLAGVPPIRMSQSAGPGSPRSGLRQVVRLLRANGFSLVRTMSLPDAQPMGIWWIDR